MIPSKSNKNALKEYLEAGTAQNFQFLSKFNERKSAQVESIRPNHSKFQDISSE